MNLRSVGRATVTRMLMAAIVLAPLSGCSRPTDKSLHDYFFAHMADFDALVAQANQDKSGHMITPNNIASADPKLRELMGKVGARYLFRGSGGGVAVTTEDWEVDGIACGYTWKPTPPSEQEIIKSIDELPKGHSSGEESGHYDRYIPLQGNWYIVFQH